MCHMVVGSMSRHKLDAVRWACDRIGMISATVFSTVSTEKRVWSDTDRACCQAMPIRKAEMRKTSRMRVCFLRSTFWKKESVLAARKMQESADTTAKATKRVRAKMVRNAPEKETV